MNADPWKPYSGENMFTKEERRKMCKGKTGELGQNRKKANEKLEEKKGRRGNCMCVAPLT